MSADMLRRAASLMRERADNATGSPWQHIPIEDEEGASDSYVISLTGSTSIGEDVGEGMAEGDAEHIASWHPAVALAVADWLEEVADMRRTISGLATYSGNDPDGGSDCFIAQETRALTVARAYLGESA